MSGHKKFVIAGEKGEISTFPEKIRHTKKFQLKFLIIGN